jgi:RNA polymerase-binding transcription factor DksA
MAVKKPTSVANRDVPPKKAAQTKVVATKAAAKTTTKASATKATEGRKDHGAESSASPSAQPQRLRVRGNEKPWTAKELATVRAALEADIVRLQREISAAELALAGLMLDAGNGAGDDQADAGTATFEREQEISLANNAREVFEQSERALAKLVDGSYGICESCASPIGKNRLLAFPRATLCMTCKSKQERR